MDEQSQLDRKNINNGSGVNNNNSDEGEKTKEMVLGLPALPPNRVTTYHNSSKVNLGITKAMVKRSQLGIRHPPYKKKKNNNINDGRGDNNNNSNEGEKTKEMVRRLPPKRGQIKLKTFETFVKSHILKVQLKGGDGSGGDKDKKGGSGDNDGGDKTEGGGGVGGKMGSKMESKGQHDNRNRFSYHTSRADPDISRPRAILLLLGAYILKNN